MKAKFIFWCFFVLAVSLHTGLFAQNSTITGKVTSAEDGAAVPGANVVVKGTTTGTVTDAEGRYSISAPGTGTLIFSFIGLVTEEVAVNNQTVVDVQLVSDLQSLQEVVVTANAIEREKKSLGYTVTEIKGDELTKGRERSFVNAMQGKVAGVQIQSNSGAPGSSTRVVIRGGTSITGNNQALYVVDGIPIDNSSFGTGDNLNNQVDAGNRGNDINPEDIESVSILKGPAAAALYGSRASNGAILITTKSGKNAAGRNKKAEVTYSGAYTFDDILRLPKFQNEFGQGAHGDVDLRENWSWGPRFDGQLRPWGQEVEGQQLQKPYVALPDNVREFFDLGRTLQNNLSIAGGNETSNYYLSLGNLNNKGIIPATGFDRTTIKLTGGTQLSNKLTSSASVNYIRTDGDLSAQGQGDNSPYNQVLQTPRDISLLALKDYTSPFNDINGFYSPYLVNPWFVLNENFYTSTMDRLIGNVQVGYKPLKWLDVTYRIGTDLYTDRRRQGFAIRRPVGQNEDVVEPGRYQEATYSVRELTSDLMVTGKRALTDDLNLSVLLGHNIRQRNESQQTGTVNELVTPGVFNFDNGNGTPTLFNYQENRRLHGVYADVNFGFRDYLFLGLTARNDWSSTLPRGNNSFFYPGVNASFVFTDALGWQGKLLSFGKIRASWAQVGNDASPYALNTYFEKGSITDGYNNSRLNFPLNGTPGFTLGNRIGNEDLKPEISESYEVGTELAFLDNRVSLEAAVYRTNSRNQILPVSIAASSGYTSKLINAGLLTNQGMELGLNATPVKAGDFTWQLSANFTRNVSQVKELFGNTRQISIGGLGGIDLVAQVGQPYGSFYISPELRDPQGNVVVDPVTGYPRTAASPQIVGNIQPEWFGGLSNTFSYKGLALNVLFDTKQGGKLYSRTMSTQEFVGTSPLTTYNDRQPFVIPGSVVETDPGVYAPNTTPVKSVEQYWTNRNDANYVIDASYVKLRELSLSYSLPKKLIDRTPFGNVQVGVSGRNLLLWTPEENTYVDPETNSFGNGNNQGFEFTSVPSTRSFGANLRFTF